MNIISILLIRVLSSRYYYTQWHMEGEKVVCLCHLTTKHLFYYKYNAQDEEREGTYQYYDVL